MRVEKTEQRVQGVVALSGGVDSAVAAALLVEQGYDVTGVMLKLWAERGAGKCQINRCCTPASVVRAQEVATQLGIPFRLIDVQDEFREAVVDYFIAEYAAGRTPCPCVPCNQTIRFGLLLDLALRSGAQFLATGHYARIQWNGERYTLLRGVDRTKDQSYFLHILGQHQLAHLRFPLGEMTKAEVREAARHRNLPVAEEPESQDLCFLGDGDYRRFLAERVPEFFMPGPIRNARGHVLGEHQGLPAYTIGQRGGLNVTAAEPLYVLEILAEENALIVGTSEELERGTCCVEAVRYVTGDTPGAPFRANVQIRSQAPAIPATVTPLSEARAQVSFDLPQRAVTPGQFLVIYNGAEVLGGGVMLPRH
jgi:tRNA-uridine 2-sulfurtransferase